MSVVNSYNLKRIDTSWIIDNKQYGSLSRPTVMAKGDNEPYQAKFNRPKDFRIGINDLVCNLIGLELELPVFEPAVADIPHGIMNGSKKLEGFESGERFAQVCLQSFKTVNSFQNRGKRLKKKTWLEISRLFQIL